MDLPGEREWSVVARLGRTRGLKGEIYGEGDWPADQYAALEQVWLRRADGSQALEGRPLRPLSVVAYKGGLIFRFEGVDSIDAAEPLVRLEVVIPRQDRPQLADGEVYLADLVGCVAVHRRTGETIGVVTGWQEAGGPLLLELKAANGKEGEPLLIPFARGICVEIDPAGRRIVVDPPEGLLELNAAESGA